MIDSQKLLDVLVKAFDYDLSGNCSYGEEKWGYNKDDNWLNSTNN